VLKGHSRPNNVVDLSAAQPSGVQQAANPDAQAPPSDFPEPQKGSVAPDFALKDLADGKEVRLSSLRGKAVLVNFWATWCEPCKIEMPWFVELQKKYEAQGFTVLGVAMDDASPSDIADFAKKMGVNYPIVIGKEAVGDQYGGIPYLPSTFYIGRDGKVVDRVFGLVSRSEIESDIQKAMGSQVAQK
jgi:thiol-disulfide isomerase/thioredoxin